MVLMIRMCGMGLSEAKAEALAVKNELQSVSPENREYFEHNYRQFAAETDALKKEYQQKFSLRPGKNWLPDMRHSPICVVTLD